MNLSLRQKPTEILLELAAVEPVTAVQCKSRIRLELCLDPAFGINTVVWHISETHIRMCVRVVIISYRKDVYSRECPDDRSVLTLPRTHHRSVHVGYDVFETFRAYHCIVYEREMGQPLVELVLGSRYVSQRFHEAGETEWEQVWECHCQ